MSKCGAISVKLFIEITSRLVSSPVNLFNIFRTPPEGCFYTFAKNSIIDFDHVLKYKSFLFHPKSFQEPLASRDVLKICSKFTGEHPCRSAISIQS